MTLERAVRHTVDHFRHTKDQLLAIILQSSGVCHMRIVYGDGALAVNSCSAAKDTQTDHKSGRVRTPKDTRSDVGVRLCPSRVTSVLQTYYIRNSTNYTLFRK